MTRRVFRVFLFSVVIALLAAACGTTQVNEPGPAATAEDPFLSGADDPADPVPTVESDLPAEPVVQATEAETTATPEAATETPVVAQTGQQTGQAAGPGVTLSTIRSRGTLVCGVNGQLPGFSFLDPQGNYAGFDVDFCRALAAAIFGNPDQVEFRSTTAQERFTVLQTGEVDVLIRNTTWSLVRDTELGLNFGPVIFYDGQGIMVPADSGFTSLQDLDGGTICVQQGTTTELNLADAMATEGIEYSPAVFDDLNATYGSYAEGRCDAVTSDLSQLSSAARAVLPDPENHTILELTLSKEPLAPAVRHGDDQWFDIVKWVVFATIAGEEYGLDSSNVTNQASTSENPEVRRLLGVEGDLGQQLGLDSNFAVNVISQVGNYAEIYERNLGEGTPTFIPRGLNSLYTEGGLLYSPPFR